MIRNESGLENALCLLEKALMAKPTKEQQKHQSQRY